MGSPSIPAAPASPDYGAASREGILTDISTLPLRNQINAGAALGNVVNYTDPRTGQPATADFRGQFDINKFLTAHPEFKQPFEQNGRSMSWLQDAVNATDYLNWNDVDNRFRAPGGNTALVGNTTQNLVDANATIQQAQLDLRKKLGVQNVEQTVAELRAADPQGWALRDALTKQITGGLGAQAPQVAPSENIASAENRLWNIANAAPGNDGRLMDLYKQAQGEYSTAVDDAGAQGTLRGLQGVAASRLGTRGEDGVARSRLSSIYDEATQLPTDFMDASQLALAPALRTAMQDYALGGRLNADETREATNNVRAGQAARGNYLGDAAAVTEAIALADRGDAKKQQRLQNLLTVQGATFGQNDALRDDSQAAKLARLANLTGLQGQSFGQEQSLRQEDRDSAAQQINTMAALAQQMFGNAQSLRGESRNAIAQRASMLGGLAGQDFGQNQQAYTTGLNAAQSAFQGTQAMANNQLQADQTNYGRKQQSLANASALVMGQPMTNQFGNLGGAQLGAVNFTPVNSPMAGQLNPNAGAQGTQFAQQNYGNLSNIWNTQAGIAAQGNPWQSIGGAAAGAGTAALIAAMI
jgi:hypothetical protein